MTPMTLDEIDFETFKYSHRFIRVGLLPSGNIAVAGADFKFLVVLDGSGITQETLDIIWKALKEAYGKPLPPQYDTSEPKKSAPASKLSLEDIGL